MFILWTLSCKDYSLISFFSNKYIHFRERKKKKKKGIKLCPEFWEACKFHVSKRIHILCKTIVYILLGRGENRC